MSKTITIECREKSSGLTDNSISGTFTTTLPQGIPISEGDVIQFKSAYIDSVAKSDDKIVLQPDDKNGTTMDVSLTCCYYILNWETSNKTYLDNASGAGDTNQPDGKTYFATKTSAVPQVAGVSQVEQMTFGSNTESANADWGDGAMTIQIQDPSSLHPNPIKYKQISLMLPRGDPRYTDLGDMVINGISQGKNKDGTDKNPNFGKMPFTYRDTDENNNPIPINKDTFKLVSPSSGDWSGDNNRYYMYPYFVGTGNPKKFSPNITVGAVDGDGQSTLFTKTLDFTLDTRTAYSPTELARLITDKLSRLNKAEANIIAGAYPTDNIFLRNQRLVREDVYETGNIQDTKVYFFAEDGSNYFNYDLTANDYMIGSDQMDLNYDEGNQKFNFQAIHTPFYGSDGAIDLRFVRNDTLNVNLLVNKSMGICFTDLQPSSLWDDILGFDATLKVSPSNLKKSFAPYGFQNWNVPILHRVDGINSTGGFLGTSAVLNKSEATVYQSPTDLFTRKVESNNATPIYAKVSQSGGKQNEPYYLVSIDMNANQDYYGATDLYKNNVKAIVGKYYSTNSYTSASGDAGVQPYTHIGEPFLLTDLKVKILDPSFYPAVGIQNNNAVFLEVIKAPPQPPKKK